MSSIASVDGNQTGPSNPYSPLPLSIKNRIRLLMQGRQELMEQDLASFVRQLSFHGAPRDLNVMADVLAAYMQAHLGTKPVKYTGTGGINHLYWKGSKSPRVVLIGHGDVQWNFDDQVARNPGIDPYQEVVINKQRWAKGPGTADMKGGLVIMLHALRVLREIDKELFRHTSVIINMDEEPGSPWSDKGLISPMRDAMLESMRQFGPHARYVVAALEFEGAANLYGAVKGARRGLSRYTVKFRGEPGHIGLGEGVDAADMGFVLRNEIVAWNRPRPRAQVKVAKFMTGKDINTTPPDGTMLIDARFESVDEQHSFEAFLDEQTTSFKGRMTIDRSNPITAGIMKPPMEWEASQDLFPLWAATRKQLGLAPTECVLGTGSADSNQFAQGVPTLAGLGPIGEREHSPEERVLLNFTDQVASTAGLLYTLLSHGRAVEHGHPGLT